MEVEQGWGKRKVRPRIGGSECSGELEGGDVRGQRGVKTCFGATSVAESLGAKGALVRAETCDQDVVGERPLDQEHEAWHTEGSKCECRATIATLRIRAAVFGAVMWTF